MENSKENWDLIIKPKAKLFDLHLHDIWRHRELVYMFVKRDFVTVYKQTILGPIWFILQPLMSTVIFTVIFGKIAKIPTDGTPQYLFYLAGLLFWSYFSDCIISTSNTFLTNAGIFGKVYFPRLIVPISIVFSNLIKFVIQFMLFAGFFIYYSAAGANIQMNLYLLMFPVLLLQTALLGLGFGLIISSLTTKYRDLAMLVGFGVNLWMYITPIVYPISQVPEQYLPLYRLNPLVAVISNFRYGILGAGQPEPILVGWLVTIAVLFVGIVIFSKVEKTFMDTV